MNDLLMKALQIAIKLQIPIKEAIIPNVVASLLQDNSASLLTGYGEPFNNSRSFFDPMGDIFEICDHDYYLELEYGNRHPGAFLAHTPELFKSIVSNIDVKSNSQLAKAKLYKLPFRSKSVSSFEHVKTIMEYQNSFLSEINKKFYRSDDLAFTKFHKHILLEMMKQYK